MNSSLPRIAHCRSTSASYVPHSAGRGLSEPASPSDERCCDCCAEGPSTSPEGVVADQRGLVGHPPSSHTSILSFLLPASGCAANCTPSMTTKRMEDGHEATRNASASHVTKGS